jgi:hypothetical protein
MVDLARDGVPPAELRARGERAVWSAVVRIACSAVQRGYTETEFVDLVYHPRHNLHRQVSLKRGREARKPLGVRRHYESAWKAAREWVHEQGTPWARADAAAEAELRAHMLYTLAGDADLDLHDTDRDLLEYVANQAQWRQMTRVTVLWRAAAEGTGLGKTAVQEALRRLVDRGLLVKISAGRRGQPARNGLRGPSTARAAVYELPDETALAPYLYRGTRSMPPPPRPMAPPRPHCHRPQPRGRRRAARAAARRGRRRRHPPPPRRTTSTRSKERPMTATPDTSCSLTITATSPEALVASIDQLRGHTPAEPAEQPRSTALASVTVINPPRARRGAR